MSTEALSIPEGRRLPRMMTLHPLVSGSFLHRHIVPRLPLTALIVIAALLDFIGLSAEGYGNTYYAAAVRSMSLSWHAFWFNSLDPAGFVSIDKPPLGFWFQVASVKIFGFNGVALMLPQALAGVLAVALLYHLVSRHFGRVAGTAAALALALTPISVVANRNNIVDGTLVFIVLLGAWAVLRAIETGKPRWLLLCAFIVGVGFNVKMLEAYLVLPAFALAYLLGSRAQWWKRFAHLGAAVLILLPVSLAWVTAVDLTPASQRPWVGSTTTNSALDLALGYNGLQRLTGNTGVGGNSNAAKFGGGGGPGGVGENGPISVLRLLNDQLGPQVSWLLPLAVIGFFAAAWLAFRRRFFAGEAIPHNSRLTTQSSQLALWATWLLTTGVFFSAAGFYHTYYLVMMAPAVAALSGIGVVSLWRLYRDSRLWLLLPLALLAGAAVQTHFLAPYPSWASWLSPLIWSVTMLTLLVLSIVKLGPRISLRWVVPIASAGLMVLVAAPATWSITSVEASSGGLLPRAGPAGAMTGLGGPPGLGAGSANRNGFPPNGRPPFANGPLPPPGVAPGGFGAAKARRFRISGPLGAQPGGGLGAFSVDTKLVTYLESHQGTATYLFGTTSANNAEPYIIKTGKAVMDTGGFTGSDPILTPAKLAKLIHARVVRYFVLDGGSFGGPGGGSQSLASYVESSCRVVPVAAYGESLTNSDRFAGAATLYDCGSANL